MLNVTKLIDSYMTYATKIL